MDQNTATTPPQATRSPMRSDELKDLIAALTKAQGAMPSVPKDANNPHFNSPYATLDAVWDAVRGPLTSNGLAVVQTVQPHQASWVLLTTLYHTSGQWISGITPLLLDKQTGQGLGSAMTYSRRYALMAICGVAPADDDDGNAAEPAKQRGRQQGAPQGRPAPQQRASGQPSGQGAASPPPARNQNTTKQGDWDRAKPGWENDPATDGQIKRMFAMAKEADFKDEAQIKSMLFELFGDAVVKDDGSDVTTKKLTKGMMEKVFARLEGKA